MKYSPRGSEAAANVVCPSPVKPSQTQPIEVGVADDDLSHADIARLDRGETDSVILAGRYRLIRRLGRGGMAAVYLAEQLDQGRREVAVKILDAKSHDWCRTIERFLWEARLAARIRHPNVVIGHDFGSTPRGVVYLVMERLDGRDLRAIVRSGGLSWRWTRYMMRQICAGVDALHRLGVVHRDLKSSNCFYIERDSVVKILDFGIATFEDAPILLHDVDDRTIIGTPEYMAPEQIRGESSDRRSDVYAAGILIYELLTGRTPFAGHTAEQVFARQLEQPPPSLTELTETASNVTGTVPAEVDAIVQKALAKRPRDRFSSMLELAAALDEVGGPVTRRAFRPKRERPYELPAFDEAPTLRRLISG